MALYAIYRDFGDFGTHHATEAPNVLAVLRRIVREGGAASEFTVRLNGDHLATVTLDHTGRYTAEVLASRHYPTDVPYSIGHWDEFHLTGDGLWVRSAPAAVED